MAFLFQCTTSRRVWSRQQCSTAVSSLEFPPQLVNSEDKRPAARCFLDMSAALFTTPLCFSAVDFVLLPCNTNNFIIFKEMQDFDMTISVSRSRK
jgi:hypothetical protein